MMTRSVFAAAVAACVAIPRSARGDTLQPIRVGTSASDDVTPMLYAKSTGMFGKGGIDLDIQRMSTGAAVVSAVIGGSLEIGKSSMLPVVSAFARGLPIRLVAPGEIWQTEAPISGLLVAKTSNITTAKDLNGKTISAVALRDSSDIYTRAWIDANGGDSQNVRVVEVPTSAVLAALLDGRIDAANISNPFFSAAVDSGKVRILGRPNDAVGKRFLVTGWFARSDYVTKNQALTQRFTQTYQQAAKYTNTHHADTTALFAAFSGLDPVTVAKMQRSTVGVELTLSDIQPIIDTMARYHVIEHPFDAADMTAPGFAVRKSTT